MNDMPWISEVIPIPKGAERADSIQLARCPGTCFLHVLFKRENGLVFADAALSREMAESLGEMLLTAVRSSGH